MENAGPPFEPRSATLGVACVSVAPEHPPPPQEDCVPMRGRAEASFPLTLFALCELLLPRPSRYQHIHGGGTHQKRLRTTAVSSTRCLEPIQSVSPHASARIACLEMGLFLSLDMKSSFKKGAANVPCTIFTQTFDPRLVCSCHSGDQAFPSCNPRTLLL